MKLQYTLKDCISCTRKENNAKSTRVRVVWTLLERGWYHLFKINRTYVMRTFSYLMISKRGFLKIFIASTYKYVEWMGRGPTALTWTGSRLRRGGEQRQCSQPLPSPLQPAWTHKLFKINIKEENNRWRTVERTGKVKYSLLATKNNQWSLK